MLIKYLQYLKRIFLWERLPFGGVVEILLPLLVIFEESYVLSSRGETTEDISSLVDIVISSALYMPYKMVQVELSILDA